MHIISNNLIKPSFILLTLLIVLSPVFFASNRPIYWLSCCIVIGILSLLFFIHKLHTKEKLSVDIKYIRLPFVAYSAVLVIVFIQAVPLLMTDFMAPYWQSMYSLIGVDSPLLSSISLEPLQTIDGLVRWASYGLVFFISLQFCRSADKAKLIIHVVLFAITACALYGLIMYLRGVEYVLWLQKVGYQGDITGTFFNRNSFATYVGIGFIISINYFIDTLVQDTKYLTKSSLIKKLIKNSITKSVVYFCLSNLFFIVLLLTHSRAGVICTLVGLLTCMLLYARTLIRKANPFILIFSILLFIIVLALLFSLGSEQLLQRFELLGNDDRWQIYRVTWSAISNNFWLGTGLGTFEDVWNVYRDALFPSGFILAVDHAHNTYLESMLELGIPTFVLLCISIIYLNWLCLKGALSRKRNSRYPCIVLGVSTQIWCHALFDFSIEMPAVTITYCLLLAIGVAQSWSEKDDKASTNISNLDRKNYGYLIVSISVVIGSVCLLPNALAALRLDNVFNKRYFDIEVSNSDLIELSEITESVMSFSGVTYRQVSYINSLLSKDDSFSESERERYQKKSIIAIESALKHKPLDGKAWKNFVYLRYNNPELFPKVDGADLLYKSTLLLPYRTDSLLYILPYIPLYWLSYTDAEREFFLEQIRYLWKTLSWESKRLEIFKRMNSPLGRYILQEALSNEKDRQLINKFIKQDEYLYND